jgi:hypothetical protein
MVAVVVLRMVLWSLSLRCVWHCGRCRCAVYGVAVAVIVLRLALQLLLLHHIWCRSHCCCTAFGVTITVVVQQVVLLLLSLRHVWHRCHYHCGMCGVAVAVARVALPSPLLHHVWRHRWMERMAVHPSAREVEGGRALHGEVEKRKKNYIHIYSAQVPLILICKGYP